MTDMKQKLEEMMNEKPKAPKAVKPTATKEDLNNAKTVIRGYIQEYIKACERQKIEAEHKKDIASNLKKQHGISPKILKRVADIKSEGKLKEWEDEVFATDQLLEVIMKED